MSVKWIWRCLWHCYLDVVQIKVIVSFESRTRARLGQSGIGKFRITGNEQIRKGRSRHSFVVVVRVLQSTFLRFGFEIRRLGRVAFWLRVGLLRRGHFFTDVCRSFFHDDLISRSFFTDKLNCRSFLPTILKLTDDCQVLKTII